MLRDPIGMPLDPLSYIALLFRRAAMRHCLGLTVLMVTSILIGMITPTIAAESDVAQLVREVGIAPGLVAHVGTSDGLLEVNLASDGRMLVHGLAYDEESVELAREKIQARGCSGLATVARWLDTTRLPYADHLVNLLVSDADARGPGLLSQEEILRVLAPAGVALIKKAGVWTKTVKPRPAAMDDWTHFDYDAAGAGVSHDRLVGPPTQLQWRSELQEYAGLGGNPAAYRPYTGFRIAGGRAFYLLNASRAGEKKPPVFAVARDAFNGVPLWKVPAMSSGSGTAQEYQFVASEDRLFTFVEQQGYPAALDARTGATVVTYDQGAKLPATSKRIAPAYVMLRYAPGVLVETSENRLYALEAATGALKWAWAEDNGFLCFPRLLAKERRALVHVVDPGVLKIEGRWANLRTRALLCLDLDTGKQIWRSTDLKDVRLGQTIQSGSRIFAFCPDGIGAGDEFKHKIGKVFCLDAATGKLLWSSEHFTWGYNLLVRDGQPFFAAPAALTHVDPASGAFETFWRASYNNRCNRTAATDDWLIMGLGVFVDRGGTATVRSIARSGCAQGPFPAHGLLYYTPNTCSCITQLRGHLALSAEPVLAPLPGSLRLLPGRDTPARPFAGKPTNLANPISSEWLPQVANGAEETPAVRDGTRSYVAVIHEHRLECRENGRPVWAFIAGGRISQPPVLHDGLCLFGSHDGYVYCLRASDGAMQWRFLAAPYERFLVSHGQVESSWPAYNVVIHQGRACFTAGLHPEVGGGIHAWGLDAHTGAVTWHKLLRRSEVTGKAGIPIAPNRVLNSPLTGDGQNLSIVGLVFNLTEPDADIQTRIDKGSLGDKNRNFGWTLRGTLPQDKTKR